MAEPEDPWAGDERRERIVDRIGNGLGRDRLDDLGGRREDDLLVTFDGGRGNRRGRRFVNWVFDRDEIRIERESRIGRGKRRANAKCHSREARGA